MSSNNVPSNLCRLPWFGFSNLPNGQAQPCCIYRGTVVDENGPMYVQKHSVEEIFRSKYMKDLRDQFRRNEQPAGCQTCWDDEKIGYRSKRLAYYDTGYGFTDKMDTLDFNVEPDFPMEYQIIISNSCNLKCRSCGPSHSSLWDKEMSDQNGAGKQVYFMPHGQPGEITGKFWSEREQWYKHLLRLEIVGGEPFYVKQWHQVWRELIAGGYAKNISIGMSTNAVLVYPDLVRELANGFRQAGISTSVDGIGKQYNYLRHPGDWAKVQGNIEQYSSLLKELYPKLSLLNTITVSWLNAWYLPEIHSYFKSVDIKVWNNILRGPDHMALSNIPDTFKRIIAEKWNNTEWDPMYQNDVQAMLGFMNSRTVNDDEFIRHLGRIRDVDVIRNENFMDSFPEIAPAIEPYWNRMLEIRGE